MIQSVSRSMFVQWAFRMVAGVALSSGLASICRADWTLTTADFKEQPQLTVNTWSAGAGLAATDSSGKLVNVPTREVISLSSEKKIAPEAASRSWKLALRNGDTLFGEAGGLSGQSLLFKVAEFGVVAVPLKRVTSLSS